MSRDAAVSLRDVGFEYPTSDGRVVRALEGVSLEIPRGATVAFVGPSGCGKSTLLKLIAGLLTATRGVVVVDGVRVTGPSKSVGMAFQNPVLLPWRTVLDNLLLPLEILRENGDPRAPGRAAWRETAVALLETLGLAGAEHRQPRELSGGMRQRVNLCRALIHTPALLLLDEPFAALDAFTREEMWELHQALRLAREFTGALVTPVHPVTFARPRTLGALYSPEGTDLIQRMRDEIRPARATVACSSRR